MTFIWTFLPVALESSLAESSLVESSPNASRSTEHTEIRLIFVAIFLIVLLRLYKHPASVTLSLREV